MKRWIFGWVIIAATLALSEGASYDILIAKGTRAKPGWAAVASALEKKYAPDSAVIEYSGSTDETLDRLKQDRPRYVCVIAEPSSLDRAFVVRMNRMTRRIDDDIYGDCLWGIITGYEAADALRIAERKEPLILKRGLHTTGCGHDTLLKNTVFSDGAAGNVETTVGHEPRKVVTMPDNDEGTVFEFTKHWNEDKPDFMVTSSHATQYNLEMPFSRGLLVSYGNRFHVLRKDQLPGFARFLGGALFKGKEAEMIAHCESLGAPVLDAGAENPKVWLGAGNCLLGDARKSRNSMVVTALSIGGFDQLVGYVVPTWYGRMGWGTLNVFTGQGDRLSLAESFFLNNQDILAETQRRFPKALSVEFNGEDISEWLKDEASIKPLAEAGYLTKELSKDALGLTHDRDVVAFYGDPAWRAGFGKPSKPGYELVVQESSAGRTVLRVKNPDDAEWKGKVFAMLPVRMNHPVCDDPSGDATVADDFVLLNGLVLKPGEEKVFTLTAGKS